MRRVITSTFLTIDGVMQAPGGPDEDRSGAFEHGGWSFHHWDEMMGQVMTEEMAQPHDLLLGRKTYEIFAAHWPHAGDAPEAVIINNARKYVASRTLTKVDWNNSTLLERDAANAVTRLKAEDGPDLRVVGSGNLIQTLTSHELVDEYEIWTFPVAVGGGKRLFEVPAGLKLLDHRVSTTGVIIARYAYDGPVTVGSFALE